MFVTSNFIIRSAFWMSQISRTDKNQHETRRTIDPNVLDASSSVSKIRPILKACSTGFNPGEEVKPYHFPILRAITMAVALCLAIKGVGPPNTFPL